MKWIRRQRIGIIFTSWLLSGSAVLTAQSAHSQAKQVPAVRAEVDLVRVPFSVADGWGTRVHVNSNLLRVFEDGKEHEIEQLLIEDMPISVALVLDSSGSMSPWFQAAQRVALEFFRTANVADEFLLIQVKSRAWLVSGFTHATGPMELNTLMSVPKGRTALLDGIYLAAGQLRNARNRRRVIIAITDGLDNHSRYGEKAVANALAEADAQVFGIQQGRPEYWGIVQKLARGTGGRVFGGFSAENTAKVIWDELRLQYVLTYRPRNPRREGKWRSIKVKLRSKPRGEGWFINAKSGYYEPH